MVQCARQEWTRLEDAVGGSLNTRNRRNKYMSLWWNQEGEDDFLVAFFACGLGHMSYERYDERHISGARMMCSSSASRRISLKSIQPLFVPGLRQHTVFCN
jgi:hypothetical protein